MTKCLANKKRMVNAWAKKKYNHDCRSFWKRFAINSFVKQGISTAGLVWNLPALEVCEKSWSQTGLFTSVPLNVPILCIRNCKKKKKGRIWNILGLVRP